MATFRKLSNGKYRADVRKNGSFIQAKTFNTKQQAEEFSASLESSIDSILRLKPKKIKKLSPAKVEELGGKWLFKKLGVELEFMTFDQLATEYMLQWTGKDHNQVYRALYWRDTFDGLPIKSITPKLVKKAVKDFSETKSFATDGTGNKSNKTRSSNTVIRYKAVLSAMFRYAIREDYLKENPVDNVFVQATPNKIERYLSDEERMQLLAECKNSTWNKMHLLVLLAITTGMRKRELMGLRWNDIDFNKGLAKLTDTKNGESRNNPIPEVTLNELRKFRQIGSSLIFNSPTRPERPFEFRKQWQGALDRAGIDNFRFHDLRHTAASYLVMAGATLYETAQVLGHKSTQTTERYAHLSTDHKSAVVERVMGNVFNVQSGGV
ncbi:integrase [Methylococcaceae bacterium CS1]|nr:site-specific integrase [Methyloprofundus sp.]TXK94592.1 integrase [Methylococcaceae bacterium CS4]TXK99087.1 integrase [Methylococcaceae bacterium CS5]TXL04078.1 integrase [Methylococcaceae bacterium CS1]TXL06679.1 integrase [Methylococcaceae bacterium CS3]TXL10812.1 integrase [Methylococcaceae bacterium CS2]